MFCTVCGAKNDDNAQVCVNCGADLNAQKTQVFGEPVSERERFMAANGGYTGEAEGKKALVVILIILGVILALIVAGILAFYILVIKKSDDMKKEAQEEFYNTEGRRMGEKLLEPIEIKEQTIYDSDVFAVKASYFGDPLDDKVHSGRIDMPCSGLFLKVKNKTGKDISVDCLSIAFNKAASTFAPELELTVPAGGVEVGMIKIFEITSRMSWRQDMKMVSVEDITLELRAKDPASGEVLEDTGIISVKTESKGNTVPKCNYESRLHEFYSANGITLADCGCTAADFRDGGGVAIYVENNTSSTISLDLEGDVDIDGVSVPGTMEDSIQAGARGICYIRLDADVMKNEFDFDPIDHNAKADIGIYTDDGKTLIDTAKYDAKLWGYAEAYPQPLYGEE